MRGTGPRDRASRGTLPRVRPGLSREGPFRVRPALPRQRLFLERTLPREGPCLERDGPFFERDRPSLEGGTLSRKGPFLELDSLASKRPALSRGTWPASGGTRIEKGWALLEKDGPGPREGLCTERNSASRVTLSRKERPFLERAPWALRRVHS
ncbi:hypothetical protein M885DRAFT_99367 [Pelagophyceae sp. CCMP2097]|nr:hypothetical protein M885DRAFT_99367 [Pelagophyceae sp. CCMP2097]